eukprot:COSAG05_NODE_19025_length_299_cov_0.670000_2_plen_27_part_01
MRAARAEDMAERSVLDTMQLRANAYVG